MRRITGFTGRQVASLLALVGLLALLVPVGARATEGMVSIIDAETLSPARVDDNGSLQVTLGGKGPVSVREVSQRPVPFTRTAGTETGGTRCSLETRYCGMNFVPPASGGRWVVLSISAHLERHDVDRAWASCALNSALAIGTVEFQLDLLDSVPDSLLHNTKTFGGAQSTNLAVPAGGGLSCAVHFQGGSGVVREASVTISGNVLP